MINTKVNITLEERGKCTDVSKGISNVLFLNLCVNVWVFMVQSSIGIHGGLVPGLSEDVRICRCSTPKYKMVYYLHITYIHPLVYFKPSLSYL
jgi:hypothetical protein